MTLKIDNAGRLVIPKPLRDRMRLDPGADLEVEETAEGLLLRRISQRPSLIEQNGILVHIGKPPKNFDWERIVEDEREERTREVEELMLKKTQKDWLGWIRSCPVGPLHD